MAREDRHLPAAPTRSAPTRRTRSGPNKVNGWVGGPHGGATLAHARPLAKAAGVGDASQAMTPPTAPRCWLMKSEPDTFSIDDLERQRKTAWEGVRNYQARNHMRDDMQVGDAVLFYHSSTTPPAVVGLARVASSPYPDPSALDRESPYFDAKSKPEDPRWILVDIAFVEKLPAPVPLDRLRDDPALRGILVAQKGQRLSVQPVERAHFEHIASLAGATRLADLLPPASR